MPDRPFPKLMYKRSMANQTEPKTPMQIVRYVVVLDPGMIFLECHDEARQIVAGNGSVASLEKEQTKVSAAPAITR